jgi:hypothetical protein
METTRRWVTRKGEEHMGEGVVVGGWWGRRGGEMGRAGRRRRAGGGQGAGTEPPEEGIGEHKHGKDWGMGLGFPSWDSHFIPPR